MRWLVRFGYDGDRFAGWARQPGLRTVEGEIRSGIERLGLVGSLESARLEVASRTDAGVHARANALAVTLDLSGEALLRSFNGFAPDIYFSATRPIPEGFRVRRAAWREYRYYLTGTRARARTLGAIARQLPKRLDVRTLGRGAAASTPSFRDLDRLSVLHDGTGVRIDVRGPGFVWGMVRKLVAGILECESGRLSTEALVAAARGSRRLTIPLAPADGLILWEVHYPGRWTERWDRTLRHQAAHLGEVRRRAETKLRTVRAIGPPS